MKGFWAIVLVMITGVAHCQEFEHIEYDRARHERDAEVCPRHTADISGDTLIAAFYRASMHYPELCNLRIKLCYGHLKTSMAARPRIGSVLFRRRANRCYLLIVNKDAESEPARLLKDLSFNASLGVMGHELAHIFDYSQQSSWKLVGTGIRYLGRRYRRTMERATDSIAIERGFGQQLYDWADYVVTRATVDEDYRQYKLKYYLTPEEIRRKIK